MKDRTGIGRDRPLAFRAPLFAALALAACSAGCARQDRGEPAQERAAELFVEIASPAGLGSGEPSLSVGPDGRLGMSWFEPRPQGGHVLLWAARVDHGWSEPSIIAEGDSFFVNWADFPSVFPSTDRLYAHWLWKSGQGTYAYEVRIAVSEDGGASWSKPAVAHDDGTATEHGFVSWAMADSGARLVWLDGRAGEGLEEEDPRRNMQLRSALVGPGPSAGESEILDPRVCDCCATAAAHTPGGTLVAYRDRTADEIRDISLMRWDGAAWSKPYAAATDGWRIAGCPVNGPALDASREHVALAWYTAANDSPRVYCALSADEGRTFGPALRIDGGHALGRVDVICLGDGSALVTCLESVGEQAQITMRRVRPDGLGPAIPVARTSPARKSGFPSAARAGKEIFVAWTDVSDSSRVRVSRADVWALADADR